MAMEFNISEDNSNNKSFSLLRTNPKLTSNVKLLVDSNDSIYLSSFKANKSLSKVELQKYELKRTGTYSTDLSRFYKGIELNERFEIFRKFSDISPYSDYEFQYEDQYNFGVSFNSTKLYDEQYSMLAPMWFERRIPKKFVIYRIEDVDYNNDYSEDAEGQNGRILELLNNATIIKTFDLTRKSNIGQYLHNHVFDNSNPSSPINFNFGEDAAVEFRGIDILNGGFTSKKEFISQEYLQRDSLEIESNEFISLGFERNGVISSNLINLEFLFDDKTADDYEIYRYFGLYVDDIAEGELDVDTFHNRGSISINPNTVKTYYDIEDTDLVDSDMLPSPNDLKYPVLSYLNIAENSYLHIKNNEPYREFRLPTSILEEGLDSQKFTPKKNKIQSHPREINHHSFIELEIIDAPNINDRIFIGDKTEIGIEGYTLYDQTCVASDSVPPGVSIKNSNSFSTHGNLNQIAISLGKLIKNLTPYKVTIDRTKIIIEDYAKGADRGRMSLGIFKTNLKDFVKVVAASKDAVTTQYNLQTLDPTHTILNDWDLYTSTGGSEKGSGFLVKSSDLGNINVGEYVKSKNLNKFFKVSCIVNDHEDRSLYRVVIEKPTGISNDGIIQLYTKFRPTFGKFSAYSIKDFDFDFYSTSNSKLNELQHEITQHIVADENETESAEKFKVSFAGLDYILESENPDGEDNEESTQINVSSEYNRLSENILKETALKSRMIPYISKFALKNGTNARNLPYTLNVNEAFGTNNLSPDIQLEVGRSTVNLNMEHFHINKLPPYLYDDYLTDLNSYLDFKFEEGFTLDMMESTEHDFFSLYFKWQGLISSNTETVIDQNGVSSQLPIWIYDTHKDLFTEFTGGTGELESSTVFRGLKYLYKKRKETEKEEPTEFIQTSEINDYKFGVVLNYETDREISTNSVEYNVIKNDKFKFICVHINMKVVENDITYISRSVAYGANDIELNGSIIDTTLSFKIDLNRTTNWDTEDETTIVKVALFEELGETSNFTNEVTKDAEGNYSWIYFDINENNSSPSLWYGFKIIEVLNNNEVIVAGRPIVFQNSINGVNVIGPSTIPLPPMDSSTISILDANNTTFYYWQSGKAGWEALFENIVSYNFARKFNKFEDISYTTIRNGEKIKNEFVLEVQDGVEIVKPSVLDTAPDGDKPKSYQLVSSEIGRVLRKRRDGGYVTILKRMNGEYTPIFKDVITFTNIYSENAQYIPNTATNEIEPLNVREYLIFNKFRYGGIAFESYKKINEKYGFIENMYYHKVNDENSKNLLKLSETTDKLPLYPAVGEIGIDKKDVNVFKSKYADDYFTKSLPGGNSNKVHGTLSPTEVKSFMASTVMKVEDIYDLTSFTSTYETGLDALDSIRNNKLESTAIHWTENENEIIADFYLPRAIYNELLEDGILQRYRKYISAENSFGDKESILDDMQKYVYKNIVNRFIIDNIEVYGVEGKDLETDFISVTEVSHLTRNDFRPLTNFEIKGYQNDGLSFRLIYTKKEDYNYNLKVHVKIQA